MPTIGPGGLANYDLDDPEDLAFLIERGFIWSGTESDQKRAIDAILSGAVPRPTAKVPPEVDAFLDEQGVPRQPADTTLAPPAEPDDLDEEVEL